MCKVCGVLMNLDVELENPHPSIKHPHENGRQHIGFKAMREWLAGSDARFSDKGLDTSHKAKYEQSDHPPPLDRVTTENDSRSVLKRVALERSGHGHRERDRERHRDRSRKERSRSRSRRRDRKEAKRRR